MIRAASLAILLLGVPQDDLDKKITQILPRLADDSIEVRDQAVKELADLGPAALPLLKQRAEKQDGETKGLLLAACRLIESRDTLGRVLPPLRKVTLEAFNQPVREAAEEIARQTGIALELQNVADGPVTLSLKDATSLQAIDEVCRKAGLQWRAADDEMALMMRRRGAAIPVVGKGPRLLLSPGKAADFPTAYIRHYKLRATQVSLTRINNFQGIQSTAQLMLDVQWSPDARPDGMQSFQVTEIKDDQGRSLLPDPAPRNRFRNSHRHYRGYSTSYPQHVPFKFPEADAKKIAVIQGSMTLTFPKDVKTIKFEKPAEARGKTMELGGLKITLKDYQDKGTSHRVSVTITGKADGDARPNDGDFESAIPFNYEDIDLVTETGEVMDNQGMSGTGDGQSYTWDLDYESEKPTAVKEIRITCVLSRHSDEVKFELRDIVLPR